MGIKTLICARCNKEFIHNTKGHPKYCPDCKPIVYQEIWSRATTKYSRSPKGKDAIKRVFNKIMSNPELKAKKLLYWKDRYHKLKAELMEKEGLNVGKQGITPISKI